MIERTGHLVAVDATDRSVGGLPENDILEWNPEQARLDRAQARLAAAITRIDRETRMYHSKLDGYEPWSVFVAPGDHAEDDLLLAA